MKVIDITKLTAGQLESTVQQLKKLKELSDPNILSYVTSFVDETRKELIIITEHYDGETLADTIEKYKKENKMIPKYDVIMFIIQLLLGLSYLHKNNIVHGNLNPKNILTNNKGDLKADLGLSEIIGFTEIAIVYSSLEIIKDKDCGYTVDIWSLGCISYELCCLKPLYTELDECKLVDLLSKPMLNNDKKLRPNCEKLLMDKFIKEYLDSIKIVYKEIKCNETINVKNLWWRS